MKTQTLPTTLWTLTALLLAALLATLWTLPAQAYWPTTTTENLVVQSTVGDTMGAHPAAISFTDGSVLVTFSKYYVGQVYQIIDRFGDLKFEIAQKVTPGLIFPGDDCRFNCQLIPDGNGGAFIAYEIQDAYPTCKGVWVQRIDSLGNRVWGDYGVRLFSEWYNNQVTRISIDNFNGLLIASQVATDGAGTHHIYIQRLDGEGNLLWGEGGIAVSANPNWDERMPSIAQDGLGGAFVSWESNNGMVRLFCQHFDGKGNRLWGQDLFIMNGTWWSMLVADGEGGCLIDCNNGGYENDLYRIDPAGNILWHHDHLSYFTIDDLERIIPGESGYFYIGFGWNWRTWGQRVDLRGTNYWSTHWGAPFLSNLQHLNVDYSLSFAFRFPYFYAIYGLFSGEMYNGQHQTFINCLDLEGNRLLGDDGILLKTTHTSNWYNNVSPLDDGGIVGVFEYNTPLPNWDYNVHAKRVNMDGTIGGPLHLLVDLVSQNPPIQIPPNGGSFTFNAAITDTYVVNSHFDAWIELTWPDGRKSDVTLRQNVQIYSNSTIDRFGLQQIVPASAPPGMYTYTLYVGSHEYHIPWSQDEFTFEKQGDGSWVSGAGKDQDRSSFRLVRNQTTEAGDWIMSGDFFGNQQGVQLNAPTQPASTGLQLSVNPNPFNPTTTFRFTLPEAARVTLEVFDINGRIVGAAAENRQGRLFHQEMYDAGTHEIVFDGSDLPSGVYLYRLAASGSGATPTTAVGKVVILK